MPAAAAALSSRKRITKVLLWLLVFAIALYLGVVALMFLFQRSLLYHPPASLPTPQAAGVAMQAVQVATGDGLRLAAWYAPPPKAGSLVVLHFHGNAGSIANRSDKARRLMAAGLGVMLMEYRGFAGNPGQPTEGGLYEDARAALRWLATQGVPASQVVLYGESLGTGVAVQMASETAPAGVILEAPYTSIPDVAALQYPYIPVRWLTLDRFDSLAKIGGVRVPLLIIHGERDGLIPIAIAQRLFSAAREPKTLIALPQAGHGDAFSWGAGEAMLSFLLSLPGNTARP